MRTYTCLHTWHTRTGTYKKRRFYTVQIRYRFRKRDYRYRPFRAVPSFPVMRVVPYIAQEKGANLMPGSTVPRYVQMIHSAYKDGKKNVP